MNINISIGSVLEELSKKAYISECSNDDGTFCVKCFYKEIAQAHQAILAEFERMLPEEKTIKEMLECLTTQDESMNEMLKKKDKIHQITGWNNCLSTIKAKLH